MDDFERLRIREAGLTLGPSTPFGGGSPAFVGQVVSSGVSVAAGKFLVVNRAVVSGNEVEGGPGTFEVGTKPILAYLVGPGTPGAGDNVICRFVAHRWVAECPAGGGGVAPTVTLTNCACTTGPVTLSMTSLDPACNYSMFQSGSLTYGPAPAAFASLGLGPGYFGDECFPDPAAAGATFIYFLTCRRNVVALTRLYATSPFGSPFRDAALYNWFIGNDGGGINTCHPFNMNHGSPFPGSDGSCFVTISG